MYSTSELDLDIVCCFLDFQNIGKVPSNNRYLVTDFLVSTHAELDLDIVCCFLNFQNISKVPSNNRYLVTNFLVTTHALVENHKNIGEQFNIIQRMS